MNRKTIITTMFALVTMAGQAQEARIDTIVPKYLINGYFFSEMPKLPDAVSSVTRLKDKEAIKKLFGEVAQAVGDRPGGYTRIIKLGTRQGDAAQVCFIELVDFDPEMAKDGGKKKTRRSRRGGAAAKAEAPAAESPVAEEAKAEAPAEEAAPAAEEAKAE